MSEAARFLESVWYGERRRRGAEAVLGPFEAAFRLAARARAALYARGILRRIALPVPVVVVGNLSVGGTGKTPLLIWLAERLRERGYSPGIVSRGYGGKSAVWPRLVEAGADPLEVGDEPVLVAERTGCPVAVGPDRVAAAELLLPPRNSGGGAEARAAASPPQAAIDVLLSDDGLQHYRLDRAVEIAVVDGRRGLGNGRCLPAGPLREPPARLDRVDAVVVNGGTWGGPDALRAEIAPLFVYRLGTEGSDAERRALADFAGRRVHAVAGIGHPERFFEMLERHGIDVVRHALPDHAEILPRDLDHAGGPVLVTEKDAVKCREFAGDDVWCVVVDLRFPPAASSALLDRVLARLPPPSASGARR
ncbi:MAG TPA: tetraacyldisaccharide 4'-kinase [Gammaproteobacteria bacterium]|nr:tetraacyldisaccharide 4'-kinase [Gammaproteobacteria bacterium]